MNRILANALRPGERAPWGEFFRLAEENKADTLENASHQQTVFAKRAFASVLNQRGESPRRGGITPRN